MNMKKYILISVIAAIVLALTLNPSCSHKSTNEVQSKAENSFSPLQSLNLSQKEPEKENQGIFQAQNIQIKEVKAKRLYKPEHSHTASIGFNKQVRSDSPLDNLFKISIDTLLQGEKAWLEYELYGLEDHSSVSRGINDALSYGGAFVKTNEEWSQQKEQINLADLQQGINVIRFTVPETAQYRYKVKNVKIRINREVENTAQDRRLVVNQPKTSYYFDGKGYVKGFVEGTGADKAIVQIGNKKLRTQNGSFEGIVSLEVDEDQKAHGEVIAQFEDGTELKVSLQYNQPALYDYLREIGNTASVNAKEVQLGQATQFSLGKLQLEIPKGALQQKTTLRGTSLRSIDMPVMSSGLVNVTGEHKGYRLLPHGTQFAKAVKVAIPYDTASLPRGYTAKDIRSYYFDEHVNRWIALPIDTVDESLCMVVSYTTHFTDFINGVLKVPEAPQTSAYTPTSLKDIKVANPLQGMNMISPPKANNHGSANLSLPIEIPAGRRGMQPQLAISYNSEGGNGWLGYGWDLSLPSIDVETRWGVPRYDAVKETESYLLNGEQLAPMVQRGAIVNRSTGDKNFSKRIKGSFEKIIRHGNSPDTYYWEVIDRSGTKYFYGAYSTSTGVEPTLVLRDSTSGKPNNIGKWALGEVRDVYGNYVKYTYKIILHNGGVSGESLGRQLYIKEITYTGNHNAPSSLYKVKFDIQDSTALIPSVNHPRLDVSTSNNLGFKTVTANLLRGITIEYNSDFIRQYLIFYKTGSFNKSIICNIAELDNEGATTILSQYGSSRKNFCKCYDKGGFATIKTHEFDYYNDEASLGFTNPINISLSSPHRMGKLFFDKVGPYSQNSLGMSKSSGNSFGGTMSIGTGLESWKKSKSGGGSYTWSKNNSEPKFMLMDIDGDGLQDMVYEDAGVIKYKKLVYAGGTYSFSTAKTISGLPDLGLSTSITNSGGLEGHVIIANASRSKSSTDNFTSRYFSDVDGDGLQDFISEDKVYICRLNASNEPVYTLQTGDKIYTTVGGCDYILRDGAVDETFTMPGKGDDVKIYDRDLVRVFRVPYDGDISISAPIQLIENTSYSRQNAKNLDGIAWSIQYGGGIRDTGYISEHDYTVHNTQDIEIDEVTKGEYIYFRLESGNSRLFDDVVWNPVIYYRDGSSYNNGDDYIDCNNKNHHEFSSDDDFLPVDNIVFAAPFDGSIRVKGYVKSNSLSDSLTIELNVNNTNIFRDTQRDGIGFDYTFDETISVVEGDEIIISALSNTNVDFSKIVYKAHAIYTSSNDASITVDTSTTTNRVERYLTMNYNIFQESYGKSLFFEIPSSDTYEFEPNISGLPSSSNGHITYAAKSINKSLGEATLEVINGSITSDPNNTIVTNLSSGDSVFFEFYTDDFDPGSSVSMSIDYNYGGGSGSHNNASISIAQADTMWKFGSLYRAWGQFSYKGQRFDHASMTFYPINKQHLYIRTLANSPGITLDTSGYYTDPSLVEESILDNGNDPLNDYFTPMFLDGKERVFRDFAQMTYLGKEEWSNFYRISETDTLYESPYVTSTTTDPARTIRKMSVDENISKGVSVGMVLNGGTSWNTFKSKSYLDFFDLNGDRYPDVVGSVEVQYTMPYGGMAASKSPDVFNGYTDYNNAESTGKGYSLGVSLPTIKDIEIASGEEAKVYMGGGHSPFKNESDAKLAYIDVNGDGLPDQILSNDIGDYVRLNYGYAFGPEVDWGVSQVANNKSDGSSSSLSVSLDNAEFNVMQFSISGGVNTGKSENEGIRSFVDINGDGLQDLIYNDRVNNLMSVSLNNGSGFDQYVDISSVSTYQKSLSENAGGIVSLTAGITVGTGKLSGTPSYSHSSSRSFDITRFIDFNNDGYLDIITATSSGYSVQLSTLQKVNMLKEVLLPTNASFTMDYELQQSSSDMPNRKYTLKSLSIYDGNPGDGFDSTVYRFAYENPIYNRFERSFYGYEEVISKQLSSGLYPNAPYRVSSEKFHNDDFIFKGLKYYESMEDSLGNLYMETYYTWNKIDSASGDIIAPGKEECFGPYYPAVSAIDKYFYEGQATAGIHTRQEFTHGTFGNVTSFIDKRDMAISEDDVSSTIEYYNDTARNFLGMPGNIQIKDYQNTLLRERSAAYYSNTGDLKELIIYNGTRESQYNLYYDTYGNLDTIMYPLDTNAHRYTLFYTYDNHIHMLPVNVSDVFNLYSQTSYDYRLQAPTQTVDITGSEMNYSYYPNGQLKGIQGPREANNSVSYSIRFDYYNQSGWVGGHPWARTTYYDEMNSGNTFEKIIFTDPLGRALQTKTKGYVYDNSTQSSSLKHIISGKVLYDHYGRPYMSYQPETTTYSANDSLLNTSLTYYNPSKMFYDALDRKTKIRMPDGTQNLMEYNFGIDAFGENRFRQTTTDSRGISIMSFIDVLQKQTTLEAPHFAHTKFIYSPLGELVESIDPEGNSTSYTYDKAGQLVSRDHPDAGVTSYAYDNAGHLMATQTANLAGISEYIRYSYNYNRLMKVEYPENPENNVYYEYGSTGHAKGRLEKVQDASGVQKFVYGPMGEVIENIRTFVVPGGSTYSFAMNFEYDSWNRTKSITYPDGEVVNYGYNVAGQLTSVSGTKGTNSYDYLEDMQYDKYGNRVVVNYGNNTESHYTYDAQMLRLTNLTTYDVNSNTIQDLDYSYDNASNITSIVNSGDVVSGMGGYYQYQYDYDSLYRLISSSGAFSPDEYTEYPYSLSMSYSASGNILNKTLTVDRLIDGVQSSVAYDHNYNYNQGQPHTISDIEDGGNGIDYSWDANGNMTQRTTSTQTRNLCWDEENRLTTVRDNSFLSSYIYDAGGERVWKLSGEVTSMQINGPQYVDLVNITNKTLYTSPYLVVNDQEYTKHFYAESQRLASKLGAGLASSVVDPQTYTVNQITSSYEAKSDSLLQMLERGWDCSDIEAGNVSIENSELNGIAEILESSADEPEGDMYFYHSDHLGSSSWITDASGSVNQHLQYLPFGEDYIYQRSSSWDVPYTFSGKEKDAETGYSYFGARYYDSDLSVWLSVDPLADKYPSMSPFMYVAGNPVMLVDPDGREIILQELYRKNKKEEYIHKNGVRQFEAFAKTKMGQFILGKFAKKGQVIAGHEYKRDGVFHRAKIDLVLRGNKGLTKGRQGETSDNTANGLVKINRLQIGIEWDERYHDMSAIETIGHEILIHAFQKAYDYMDNEKLDNSNINKSLKKFGKKNNYNTGNFQHFQERLYDRRLEKYLVPLLLEYYSKHGIERTKENTLDEVYDYQD
jgi:RHS repeat-associated protein